jgi:hypothetical protein
MAIGLSALAPSDEALASVPPRFSIAKSSPNHAHNHKREILGLGKVYSPLLLNNGWSKVADRRFVVGKRGGINNQTIDMTTTKQTIIDIILTLLCVAGGVLLYVIL